MKNFIKISALFLTLFLSFTSCEEDDSLEFVAAPQGEFEFTNTFLSEYSLPAESSTNDNIGVIFSFNPANFDVPTNVSYELQSSVLGDFSDATVVPTLSNANNQIEVSIGELKLLAEAYEIPVPGMGDLNFRVRAFVGDPISTTEKFTPIQSITVNLLEPQTGVVVNCEYDQLWLVGAGVPDAGWGWGSPVALPCAGDGVYSGEVTLQSTTDANNFRFFTDATLEWSSPSFNYPYFANEGFAINPDFEDAMDGDNNFAYTGANGTYTLTVDFTNKIITLDASCEYDQLWAVGAGVPDAGWGWDSPVQLYCLGSGAYGANVNFASTADSNNFRFFSDATLEWASPSFSYTYYENEGYTIDPDLVNAMDDDNNFAYIGADGYRGIVIDTVNKTITLN
ncbi:SusE domain-containing protein [Mesoflavibacter sp. CH_XMU1404-2]|uniref:SusE domain-containing protein n=1 Tax=Mesoflavibacter sp. CH_XMU1404-2 TaxID=3107766 RepID=UPI003008DE76